MRTPDPTKIRLVVYEYLDFRRLLQDLYNEFKLKRPGFTVRSFAKTAGIKSPGFLKMIIDGERRLTPDMRDAFCKAFEIDARGKRYFDVLVDYNQTDDPAKKSEYFEMLNQLRPRSQKFSLEKATHRYLTRDYYVTIREMVLLDDFREDYEWMAARCAPPISVEQAEDAVKTLLELGFLKRDEQGGLVHSHGIVQTENRDTQAIEAYHFHQAVLDKARYQLGYLEQGKRHYQALSLTLPTNMVSEVIDKYLEFRDWIIKRSNELGACEEVYQVNFQMFPTTAKRMEE